MSAPTVFICGITGTQGSAVAHHVFNKPGWSAHGLVRNPDTPTAQELASRGAELFHAPRGYDDLDVLAQAMSGCTAVFMAMMPDFADPSAELRQARAILAAAAAGARVVLSTGFSSDRPWDNDGWGEEKLFAKFLMSKHHIEGAVREADGVESWTILRPGTFMANFLKPKVMIYPELVNDGVWKTALLPDSQMALIDGLDIGAFAVAAIEDPGKFNKAEIALAGESMVPGRIMEVLSKAVGRELRAEFMSAEEVEAQKDNPFIQGNVAMRRASRFFDKEKAESWGLSFGTFEQFLEREKKSVKETYA